MAKRKRSTKKTYSRRRSVGSVNTGQIINQSGFLLAGLAAAGILNKTVLANKSDNIKALIPIALGIGLPMFIKSDLGKFAGLGMIASGGNRLLQKFNIAGLGDDSSFEVPISVSGDGLSLIAGVNDDDLIMAGMGYNDDDTDTMAGDDSLTMLAGLGY
jgi:hypothetical protein